MLRSIVSKKYIGGGAPLKFDSGPWLVCQTVHVWNIAAKIMGWAAGSFLFCEANAFRKLDGFNNEMSNLFKALKDKEKKREKLLNDIDTKSVKKIPKKKNMSEWEKKFKKLEQQK